MKIFSYLPGQGRRIDAYGSTGAWIMPVIEASNDLSVVSLRLGPHGVLGLHPATADQLLMVVTGGAYVSTVDQGEIQIEAGSMVVWKSGELHRTRAGEHGMLAVIIEGEGLAGSIKMP